MLTFYEKMQTNRESSLVKILKTLERPSYKDYLIYPKNLEKISKIKVFKDFLKKRIK